jgi:hypothetical protein
MDDKKKPKGRDFPLAPTPSPNKDSTAFYQKRMLSDMDMAWRSSGELKQVFNKKVSQDASDLERQSKKGKSGYDAMGFPKNKN